MLLLELLPFSAFFRTCALLPLSGLLAGSPMQRRWKFGFALLLFAGIAVSLRGQSSTPPAAPAQAIRVSSNLVYVGVNVTDSGGHFVSGLRAKDFEVFDSGVRQPVTGFASDQDPAQVVLLIENGAIDWLMAKMHRSLLVDADALVARIPAQDRVAILTYSDRPEIVSDFTVEKDVTRGALRKLNADLESGGALAGSLDLSASLYDTLNWLSASRGAKTIVLFSSGFDSTPPAEWLAIHQRLAAADVRILAVSVFGDLRLPEKRRHLSQDERDDRAFVKEGIDAGDSSLAQLAAATGGRAFFPKDIKAFAAAFDSVSQLIRGQYTLAFVPTVFDGQLHTIDVKLHHHPFSRIEHRQAYLASAPSSP
jgi:Ca-activated chloride channel family protein